MMKRRRFIKSLIVGVAGIIATPAIVAKALQSAPKWTGLYRVSDILMEDAIMIDPSIREEIARRMLESVDRQILYGDKKSDRPTGEPS